MPDSKRHSLTFCSPGFEHMDRIEAIRTSSGTTLYAYSFASIYTWQSSEQYQICISGDAYIVKYGSRGDNAYLFPCGSDEGRKKLIDALISEGNPEFYYICDKDKDYLEKTYPGSFVFSECRDDYPYLYDKEDQLKHEGKEYRHLRHSINLGRSAGEWTHELLSADNIGRALGINRKWTESRTEGDLSDAHAAEIALENFERLGMWGALFSADGRDIAYVAGVFITPQIYDICFCKVLDKNCDCFVKWYLYKILPPEVKTVDSEEDMGIEGLRIHKTQRHPKELVRVWKGIFKG